MIEDERYGTQTRQRRIPFAGRVLVDPKDGTPAENEEIHDLSMGGMFIKCILPLPPDTVVDVVLTLQSYRLRTSARVLWTRPVEKDASRPAGMAVTFLSLTPAQKKLLYLQIDAHLKTGGELFVGTPRSQTTGTPRPSAQDESASSLNRAKIWMLAGLVVAAAVVITVVVIALL
jgi:Tfp pilus assembly protein PilZ